MAHFRPVKLGTLAVGDFYVSKPSSEVREILEITVSRNDRNQVTSAIIKYCAGGKEALVGEVVYDADKEPEYDVVVS